MEVCIGIVVVLLIMAMITNRDDTNVIVGLAASAIGLLIMLCLGAAFVAAFVKGIGGT